MTTDDTSRAETPGSDITAMLIDLARFSQRVGPAAAGEPGEVAVSLLERVMALCEAERGAILLPREYPVPSGQFSGVVPPRARRFRILTRLNVSEEDALALSAQFSTRGAAIQAPAAEPSWLIGRLTLMPLASQGDLPADALLLLGWDAADAGKYALAVQKGLALLPPILDAVGSVAVSIQLAEHVSELEAAANRKALQEMELLKAELLGTVSHELRSPLASIKGYAATLLRHERRISREERHEFLIAINEASDRLALLIDRLLEISQLETGTISIERTSVNLVDLAREAVTMAEQRLEASQQVEGTAAAARHLTFSLRIEDLHGLSTRGEIRIQADRYRLREVLDHLLENAVNYSPREGTVELIIRPLGARSAIAERYLAADGFDGPESRREGLRSKHRSRQMVEISVRDYGDGIPTEHLKRVFDRFHRVDTGLTREVNGLGLGLTICKRIIDLHEGEIWAESTVGQGSTFHVWLPVEGSGLSSFK